jgi:hypothetical protein
MTIKVKAKQLKRIVELLDYSWYYADDSDNRKMCDEIQLVQRQMRKNLENHDDKKTT